MKLFAFIGAAGLVAISYSWINSSEPTSTHTFVSADVDWSIPLPSLNISVTPSSEIEPFANEKRRHRIQASIEPTQILENSDIKTIITATPLPEVAEATAEPWTQEKWYQQYEKEIRAKRMDSHTHLQNIHALKNADGLFADPIFQTLFEKQGQNDFPDIHLPKGNRSLLAEQYVAELISKHHPVEHVNVRCNGMSCWMVGYYQAPNREVYENHIVTAEIDDACEDWDANIWLCDMNSLWSISPERSKHIGFYAHVLFDNNFKESDVPFGFLDSGALLNADNQVIEDTIKQYIEQMIYQQKDSTSPEALLKRIRCKKNYCKITVSHSRYEDIHESFDVISYGLPYENETKKERAYYLMDGVRHYLSPDEEVPSNAVVGSVTRTKFSNGVKRLYDFSRFCIEVVGRNKVKNGKLYYDTKWHCEVAENG